MFDLKLETSQSPFFALSWTVIHVIDETSPLFNLSAADIADERVRVHATFVGIDDVYAQTVHWWHAYSCEDIVFANGFTDMVSFDEDDSVTIDYTKLHQFD